MPKTNSHHTSTRPPRRQVQLDERDETLVIERTVRNHILMGRRETDPIKYEVLIYTRATMVFYLEDHKVAFVKIIKKKKKKL